MDKFGRNYNLIIQTDNEGHFTTVTLPFTLEFDIIRNTLTSANLCQLRIYNLSEQTRNLLRFNASNYGVYRQVILRAGYGTNLPIVFQGNISQAWSVREGVNFITQIECYSGGFAFVNGKTDIPFSENLSFKTVIENLISSLPHITLGGVGDTYDGTIKRGSTYSGNTKNILNELTGSGFFVDNEKGYALSTNEYITLGDQSADLIINADSGLLGTPVLEQTIVRFDMLFEPNIKIGQLAQIESITEKNFNGLYKITAVKHRGMISEAVCGDLVTTGEFFFTKLLTPVKGNA